MDTANPETGADLLSRMQGLLAEERGDAPTEEAKPTDEAPEVEAQAETEEAAPETLDTEESAAEEPSLYTVKVNGKEKRVTLDELQSGYQMEQDYRQKTSALAEEKRAFEQEKTAKLQSISDHAQQLEALIKETEEQVNWDELREYDTPKYLALKEKQQQRKEALQKAKHAAQAESDKQFAAYVAEQFEHLSNKLPEWKDEKVAAKERQMIAKTLKDSGYSNEELNNLFDHRAVILARKAALYDQLMAKTQTVKPKVQAAPQIQKPGVKTNPKQAEDQALRQKLRKSGSLDDAVNLFISRKR